jgi:pyruvate dehydrogenase E1 component alpha subunit
VERARRGGGPAFLLCNTYRYHGHHVGDVDRAYYRAKAEEELWRTERDPIARLRGWLLDQGATGPEALQAIEEEARAEVARGVAFALDAPFPDPREVTDDVYA